MLHSDGTVELEGMTGRFAPHLFKIWVDVSDVRIGQWADYA